MYSMDKIYKGKFLQNVINCLTGSEHQAFFHFGSLSMNVFLLENFGYMIHTYVRMYVCSNQCINKFQLITFEGLSSYNLRKFDGFIYNTRVIDIY